jgi:hypothetical protein
MFRSLCGKLFHGSTQVHYRHVCLERAPSGSGSLGSPECSQESVYVDTVWMHGWDADGAEPTSPDPILAHAHAPDLRTLVLDIHDAAHFPAFEALVQGLFARTKVRTVVVALQDPRPTQECLFPTCVLVPRMDPGLSVHVMTPSTQFTMELVAAGPGTIRCPLPLIRPGDSETSMDRMEEYQDHFPDVNKYVNYDTEEEVCSGPVDGDVTVVEVDADRLLGYPQDFYEMGQKVAAMCPALEHLIVHIDDMGRNMAHLGKLLNGIGKPMRSLVLFFFQAERYWGQYLSPCQWDMQVVVDMGPGSTCAPASAGWACRDDVNTCGEFCKVVFCSSGTM